MAISAPIRLLSVTLRMHCLHILRTALWLKMWSNIPPAFYRPAQVSKRWEAFLFPTCRIAVLLREYQVMPSLTRLKIYRAVNHIEPTASGT